MTYWEYLQTIERHVAFPVFPLFLVGRVGVRRSEGGETR